MKPKKLFLIFVLGVMLITACAPQATPTPVPTPIPPTPTAASVINLKHLPGVESVLGDKTSGHPLKGTVVIAEQGEVLLNKAFGLADRDQKIDNIPQTRFRVDGIMAQFTALAMLLLQNQGKLDLQDSICDYMPDCPAAWQEITLHHLLAWKSGLPDPTDMSIIDDGKVTFEELAAQLKDQPLLAQPGEKWNLTMSDYVLLGNVIEQVSGEPLEDFIQANIFTPLGMTNTGFDPNPSDLALGYPSSLLNEPVTPAAVSTGNFSTTLYSTAEDLYKFDQALAAGQSGLQGLADVMVENGYGWLVTRYAGRDLLLYHAYMDGYQAANALFPDEQVVIVLLGNQQDTDLLERAQFIGDMLVEEK